MVGMSTEYLRDHGTGTAGATAAVAGEYFITDHVAAAIAVTMPRTHTFEVPAGSAAPAGRAGARLQSSTLSLKYYFAPDQRLRPYLGAGIDVTTLYGANGVAGLDRVTAGPAVEAGLDFSLTPTGCSMPQSAGLRSVRMPAARGGHSIWIRCSSGWDSSTGSAHPHREAAIFLRGGNAQPEAFS